MKASSRTLLLVLAGTLAPVTLGAIACASKAAATADTDCATLSTCCEKMSAATASTCNAIVAAGTQTGNQAVCTTTLQSYLQGGLCGGAAEAGHPVTFDTGVPCELTSSCSPQHDGGHVTIVDAGTDAAPHAGCVAKGSCTDGQTYMECTTVGASTCSAVFVFSGGTQITCASCSDCTAAQSAAQSLCGSQTMPGKDAGGGVDCGVAPKLHPEVEAGVFCPFTPTGSVHCTAGQECCEAPSTTPSSSSCQAGGITCPIAGSITWECNGPTDCVGNASGAVCCGVGAVTTETACNYDVGSGFTGSHCGQACGPGEISLCTAATDPCVAGTCTAFKVAGLNLATCK